MEHVDGYRGSAGMDEPMRFNDNDKNQGGDNEEEEEKGMSSLFIVTYKRSLEVTF